MRIKISKYYQDEHCGNCAITDRGEFGRMGPMLRGNERPETEKQLGCHLPDDYWAWLLVLNGGFPFWGPDRTSYFSYTGDDGELKGDLMDCFFGVHYPGGEFDLVARNKQLRSRVPKEFIAIGMPNSDNPNRFMLLNVSGKDRGMVCDWYRPLIRGKRGDYRMDRTANSFTQFWDGLLDRHPLPDEEAD